MKEPLDQLVAELIASGKFEQLAEDGTPRARIARAAIELFAEQSYEATTTKAIATRARTTERTLFKHFNSKDELFARTVFPAFLKALVPELLEPVETLLTASTTDFRATLRALLVQRITVAVERPTIFIMVWREMLTRPAFRSAYREVLFARGMTAMGKLITAGKRDGHLRDLTPQVIVRGISGQLAGYLVSRLVVAPDLAWDTESDADQMLQVILHGIAVPHEESGG